MLIIYNRSEGLPFFQKKKISDCVIHIIVIKEEIKPQEKVIKTLGSFPCSVSQERYDL